ncbi:MAG: ribose 5-phosphate isomerase B [Alphaproteobacteria bacterium]
MKPILLASDHAGFHLKRVVVDHLAARRLPVIDLGTHSEESVDYPDFADRMAEAIKAGEGNRGVLICGTGIGIAMAANRHPAVRAAVCHDVSSAQLTRRHNDANVLALGARLIGETVALDCVDAFLGTEFEGGRHGRRVDKMSRLPALTTQQTETDN